MTQLLSATKPTDRISQLLPSVKCSSCGLPVPLHELGDHVCPVQKISPSQAILARIRSPSQSTSPPPPPQPQPTHARSPAPRTQSPSPAPRPQTPVSPRPPAHTVPSIQHRMQSPAPRAQSPLSLRGRMPDQPILIPPNRPSSATPSRLQSPLAPPRSPATPQLDSPRRPSINDVHPVNNARRPSVSTLRIPSPAPPPSAHSSLHEIAHTPQTPHFPPPDTKSGGEAGMAGVGRRGFQAAAQAALFAAHIQSRYGTPSPGPQLDWPGPSMDGRRANAPHYLSINPNLDPGRGTPPLSPNSGYSSHSPHSPFSQSPVSGSGPHPAIASSRTPSPINQSFMSPHSPVPISKSPETPRVMTPDTITSASTSPIPPAQQPYSNHDAPLSSSPTDAHPISTLPINDTEPPYSPSSSSEYSGLAYDDDEPLSPRSPALRPSKSDSAALHRSANSHVRFPITDPSSSSTPINNNRASAGSSSPTSPKARASAARSASSASAYSFSSRSTSRSMGALDRAMETLFEDPLSPPSPALPLPQHFPPMPMSPTERPVKLPARSRTAPTLSTTKPLGAGAGSESGDEGAGKPKRRAKVRECARCERKIDDGRWIKAEGAGVLCERCWKTMYLPKCRRCNRPIEKQAVSSSDGQLKGKYHRECFNCHTCHKPFPEKEFYVFDGKPFCAYHYHEANDSLCAARACGQPIEGACAVAHTGERYHPEHLTCEYEYPAQADADADPNSNSGAGEGESGSGSGRVRCEERLEEYWEVDGRMLCERHAVCAEDALGRGIEREGGRGVMESDTEARRMRRVTRFIDLR